MFCLLIDPVDTRLKIKIIGHFSGLHAIPKLERIEWDENSTEMSQIC